MVYEVWRMKYEYGVRTGQVLESPSMLSDITLRMNAESILELS